SLPGANAAPPFRSFPFTLCRFSGLCPLPIRGAGSASGGPHLKLQHDVSQLNPVAVLEGPYVGHRFVVDSCLLRRPLIVVEDEALAFALDHGMVFLDVHVAEQGDVGMLVPADEIVPVEQCVLPALLPTAKDT